MTRLKLVINVVTVLGMLSAGFLLSACAAPQAVVETVEVPVKETVLVEITPTPQPEGKITLQLAGWGPGEATFQPIWSEIESTYESLNPNIDIELIPLGYEILRTQLIVMATGGNAPDLAQVDTIVDLDLASLGVTAPLDDLLSAEFKADLVPSLMENSMYNGEIHAIPMSPVPHSLWQNTVLAERAGVSDVEIETIDDLVEVARAVRALGTDAEGNTIWGMSFDTAWPVLTAIQTYSFLRSFGCDWTDAEGMVSIDAPECVEALTWIKGVVDEGVAGPPGVDIRETRSVFARELTGFEVDTCSSVSIFRDFSGLGEEFDTHWRLVGWPDNPPYEGVADYYAHSFVVFQQSEQKEEAVKFIEWLLTDADMYGKYFKVSGAPPATLSLLDGDPTYAVPSVQTIKKQMESWERPAAMYPSKINEIMTFVGHGINRSLVEGVDPATALNETAANLRLLLGQ